MHPPASLDAPTGLQRCTHQPPSMPPRHPNDAWIRPLEEEGIEPHPGPRFINKNVNGLASPGRLDDCLYAMQQEQQQGTVAAFFLQEHNLHPSTDEATVRKAGARYGLLWLAGYKLASDPRTKGHGTAIVIPYDSIELKQGEMRHEAIRRGA